jgi:hypothetical protein
MKLQLRGGINERGVQYEFCHEVRRKNYSKFVYDEIRCGLGCPEDENRFILVRNPPTDPRIPVPTRGYAEVVGLEETERRVYEDMLKWAKRHGHKVVDNTKYAEPEKEA